MNIWYLTFKDDLEVFFAFVSANGTSDTWRILGGMLVRFYSRFGSVFFLLFLIFLDSLNKDTSFLWTGSIMIVDKFTLTILIN